MRKSDAIDAIERNNAAYILQFTYADGCVVVDGPDLLRVDSALPIMNRVLLARIGRRDARRVVGEQIDYFRARNVPFVWTVGPTTRPRHLGAKLLAAGLVEVADWVGMGRATGGRSGPFDTGSVSVRAVETEDDLAVWSGVAAEAYGLTDELARLFDGSFRAIGLNGGSRYLLARDGDRPVGTGCVFFSGEVAGLYWIGTVESARRRGAATAITDRALALAAKAGCRLVVLQATPQARSIYDRFGFDAVGRYRSYLWQPEGGDPRGRIRRFFRPGPQEPVGEMTAKQKIARCFGCAVPDAESNWGYVSHWSIIGSSHCSHGS